MKRDNTKLIFIISVLLTIIISISLLYFFKIITNKNNSAAETLSTLSNKMTQKKQVETLLQKSAELKSIDKSINNYFVNSSKISDFVDSIDALGTKNSTELTVLNVEQSQKDKNTILVKVSMKGSFSNVIKTVYLLEDSPFYINITQAFMNVDKSKILTDEKKTDSKKIFSGPNKWVADITFKVLSLQKYE